MPLKTKYLKYAPKKFIYKSFNVSSEGEKESIVIKK